MIIEAVDGAEHAEGLVRAQLKPELRALTKQGSDAAGQCPALLPGDHAQHPRGPGTRVQDAGEHLDRGRLARPVGSDEGDALARLNGEGDGPHRFDTNSAMPPTALEDLREGLDFDRHCRDSAAGALIDELWRPVAQAAPQFATGPPA